MGQSTHRITRARGCPRTGGPCLPGHAMLTRLSVTLNDLGAAVSDEFEISGHAVLTCDQGLCHAVWSATPCTAQVFTDTSPGIRSETLAVRTHRGGMIVAERSMEPAQ